MKKRTFLMLLLCAALLLTAAVNASSPKVVDGADLLTSSEEATLEETAEKLYGRGYDICLLTMNGGYGGKSVSDYADDYYEDNGYGVGSKRTGVLFLINMTERDMYISTAGDCIYAFTDYGITELLDELAPYFSDGDYFEGFSRFLAEAERYVDAYENGDPVDAPSGSYDGGYITPGDKVYYDDTDVLDTLPVCLVLGFVISLIVMLFVRRSMNTARISNDASHAIKAGGFELTRSHDRFLYSRTRRIPRDTDSGGSRSGGSSSHRSSGGISHGGGGRKF